jgi:hypothetical protein
MVSRNGLPPTMIAYALRHGEDTILVDPLVSGGTEPLFAASQLWATARALAASLARPPWRRASLY